MLELFSLVNAKATQPDAFTSSAMYIMSVVALWVQYTVYLESPSKVALLSYSAERFANEVPQNSSKDSTTDSSMFHSNTDVSKIRLFWNTCPSEEDKSLGRYQDKMISGYLADIRPYYTTKLVQRANN